MATPQCIGIIMDGNRRYAKASGLPALEGHRAGYKKLLEVSEWCREAGVKNLIVYAFSTENWKRTEEEVGYLMNLFRSVIAEQVESAMKNDTRLIFLGERSWVAADIRKAMEDAEDQTKNNKSFNFGIALSYGGREEILNAVRSASAMQGGAIDEEKFSELLYTKDLPDPDIIIRTSGERRLSGFLPWQSVYSELFFTDTLWPAISREEFTGILKEYAERERRYGK
jgi:undecaprenyl diphosphate synthase